MTRVSRCRSPLLGLGILTLLTNPLTGQEPGAGTLTIDGEIQSFTVQQCSRGPAERGGGNMVNVSATGDDGSFTFDMTEQTTRGGMLQLVRIFFPDGSILAADHRKSGEDWTSSGEPVSGPLFQDDGSTMVVSGTLIDQANSEEHVVEISVECAG